MAVTSRIPVAGMHLLQFEGDDADFCSRIIVVRDARTAVGALARAWESRYFALEEQPPGWWGDPWSFTLIDGWESLLGRPLAEVCSKQWLTLAIAALKASPDATVVRYEDLVTDPRGSEITVSELYGTPVTVALAEPDDPWERPLDIGEVLAGLSSCNDLLEEYLSLVEARGVSGYREPLAAREEEDVDLRQPSEGTAFHSAFTASVPQLLAAAGASLLITTYKAGQAIIARTEDGTSLDTSFTAMGRPMGTAIGGNRLAVGTADSVVVYMRHAASNRVHLMPPPDAVFVPKVISFTGDVAVHDMGWDDTGTLWFVNTRFSCLSTLDPYSSFNCAWKPNWISNLAAEDRCHLNGLAMVDGQPRYVTALAVTDEAAGWREHKGTGGVIVDITTDEVLTSGLAMPHSPRWHDGRLWFLESGNGSISYLDANRNRIEVARLPGFTRGLAFIGPYALIGLSQVRESVFTGLPVTESAAERNCGVWVVDTRTGEIAGFLRFSGTVTEIFDVQVLGARWPYLADPGELTQESFSLDTETLALVAQPVRS